MTIQIATPGDLARLLRGQDLLGLNRLQVSGFTQLDGGVAINGPATLNGLPLFPGGVQVVDDQTVAVATNVITIPARGTFPRGGRVLRVRGSVQNSSAGAATMVAFVNNDSSAVYTWQNLQGSGAGTSGNDQGAALATDSAFAIAGGTWDAKAFNFFMLEFYLYDSSDRHKIFWSLSVDRESGTPTGSMRNNVLSGMWAPAVDAPISTLVFGWSTAVNFQPGSRFTTEIS